MVWTDVLQLILMIASLVALLIKGIADMGIGNVWERNWNSSRIDFFKLFYYIVIILLYAYHAF